MTMDAGRVDGVSPRRVDVPAGDSARTNAGAVRVPVGGGGSRR